MDIKVNNELYYTSWDEFAIYDIWAIVTSEYYVFHNKSTQRALGRSPEEKVKSYIGAISRGPLMLSTK